MIIFDEDWVTEEWLEKERQVDEEIKSGKIYTYNTIEDFLNDLPLDKNEVS